MCTFEELRKEYLEQKEKLVEFYWKTLLSLGIGIAFFSDNLKDKYHILIYFSFPMMMFYYGIYKEIKEKYLKILSQEEKKKIEKDDNLLEVGVYCLFVAILGIIIVSILYDYLKIFLQKRRLIWGRVQI